MTPEQVSPRPLDVAAKSRGSWRYTRLAAVLVLLPTVPMLLASIAALVLFYASPGRFESLLGRLPGEEAIRTILFFAPATLFAVVVLAFLYAVERPHPRAGPPVSRGRWSASAIILMIAVPLLLLSAAAWTGRFIAPGRFGSLLATLPGTTYLQWAISLAPIAFFAIALIALLRILASRARSDLYAVEAADASVSTPETWAALAPRLARLGAGLVLLPTLPMLLLSLLGLGLYYLAPDRLQSLVERLSQPTVVRLGVLFTPVVLLAVVLLAGLYLVALPGRSRVEKPPAAGSPTPPRTPDSLRQAAAIGVLVTGLIAAVVIGVGLLGAVAWLLLR
jgi:hypothetical protein